MDKLVFCIPSYKRPYAVQTLCLIPDAKVYVAKKEAGEYRKNNPNAQIIEIPDNIQGNIARVRNYILDNNNGKAIIMLDDDIKAFCRIKIKGNKKVWVDIKKGDIRHLFEEFAKLAEQWGVDYFGLNCKPDAMSCRLFSPFSTNNFIGGPVQGFLPTNKCRYDERIPLKEDYDMAIQQCNKKRGCLRFNLYSFRAKQSEQKGGCANMRNMQEEKREFEILRQKWGSNIVKIDKSNQGKTKKQKVFDYNPKIYIPIKGV